MSAPTAARYEAALRWLYGLSARGIRLHLERMRGAVAARGAPQAGLRVVHVAGSNGKGSVCAMVERGLRAAGYRTGLFTSPHLHRYAERIRIAGRPLAEGEVADRLEELRRAMPALPRLTFFEVTALLAFEAFRDHGVDVVVLEVGLGGRLDATNVVETPLCSVVTGIALEHTRILGDTLEAIAGEKAGVIKRDCPVVIGEAAPGPRSVLRRRANGRKAPAWLLGRDFEGRSLADGRAAIRVGRARAASESAASESAVFEHTLRLGLGRAPYQARNAAVAAATMRCLGEPGVPVPDDAIVRGLRGARWAGRAERVRVPGGPDFLFDAGHNPQGCAAAAALLPRPPTRKTVLLFGALADKDHEGMLAAFDGRVQRRVYATPGMRRAADVTAFPALRPGTLARSVLDGLARARRMAGPEGLVVVVGSIFLVQEVRAAVLGLRSDPPIAM
ncbi:MAG: folylpolyglutamate synthase/dihydrofolate synthase family protein [Myxococcota bacterium]